MNKRVEKKHLRKTVLLEQAIRKECEEMRNVGQDSNEKLTAIAARTEMQEEILDLFYKELHLVIIIQLITTKAVRSTNWNILQNVDKKDLNN